MGIDRIPGTARTRMAAGNDSDILVDGIRDDAEEATLRDVLAILRAESEDYYRCMALEDTVES